MSEEIGSIYIVLVVIKSFPGRLLKPSGQTLTRYFHLPLPQVEVIAILRVLQQILQLQRRAVAACYYRDSKRHVMEILMEVVCMRGRCRKKGEVDMRGRVTSVT